MLYLLSRLLKSDKGKLLIVSKAEISFDALCGEG